MSDYDLFLDLGTVTGWVITYDDGTTISGTWNFKPRRGDGAGVRFLRLQSQLDNAKGTGTRLSRVVYELPAGHYKSGAADDCIKGLVAHVQSWCERNAVPCEGYSPSEIKKVATGKGNANKEAVIAAARLRWPEQSIVDGNQADALWLSVLAAKEPTNSPTHS